MSKSSFAGRDTVGIGKEIQIDKDIVKVGGCNGRITFIVQSQMERLFVVFWRYDSHIVFFDVQLSKFECDSRIGTDQKGSSRS